MKLSLIGTGYMGFPIAVKLIEAGHELGVFNRTVQKAEPLLEKGAIVFNKFKDSVEFADTIIIMLSDIKAINALLGEMDLSIMKGKTVIQMSTIAPGESLELRERFQDFGADYFEAPVLGSIPQIETKTLIVLAGSDNQQFESNKELFSAFSNDIRHIGAVGQASSLKLALNQLIIGMTSVFSMSLGFVRERGLDTDVFMDIVRNSALYSPTFDKKLDNYLSRDFSNPNFPLKLLLKDLNLIIDAFSSEQINIEALKGMQRILKEGVEDGLGEMDYSALYNVIHKA